jgi:nitrate reductase NapAB chaperone NapD
MNEVQANLVHHHQDQQQQQQQKRRMLHLLLIQVENSTKIDYISRKKIFHF